MAWYVTLDASLMISAIKIRAEMRSYATSRYTYESCGVCRLWEESTGPQTKKKDMYNFVILSAGKPRKSHSVLDEHA